MGYLFILFPVITFCLGTWQIYRLQWKMDLISKLNSIIQNDAIDFPDQLVSLEEMEYVKVKVKGYIDQWSEPQFIFPRSFIKNEETHQNSLFSMSNKDVGKNIGAQLIIPFVITEKRLTDSNSQPLRILVNFGWVTSGTMEKVNSFLKKQNQFPEHMKKKVPTEIELIGVVRKTEKREPFTLKEEYTKKRYWTRRNIEKIANHLQTHPIFLDAVESYPIKLFENDELELYPIGGQTRVNLRNEHLSYIITWYSLTGIFSYLWYKKIFKTRL